MRRKDRHIYANNANKNQKKLKKVFNTLFLQRKMLHNYKKALPLRRVFSKKKKCDGKPDAIHYII